jgi:exo-beta-1,3-glucanase (GH17 family)
MSCRRGNSYTIKAGDTLYIVAQQQLGNGERWREIIKPDGTPFTDDEVRNLRVGEEICLPGDESSPTKFLGVTFQPYVGKWTGSAPNAKTPFWNSYSQQDIVRMLEVIASQFNKIATYGMGIAGYYPPTTPWNQVDSNCHVAGAAAQLNQQRGKVAIEVALGIYQQSDGALQQREIEAAFSAAQAANAVYPNTVTSLVFTNEYTIDAQTTNAVNAMIAANKQRAHNQNIKVGVRSHTFGQIANPNSSYYKELKTLIQNCDFILCNLYPPPNAATPQDGVNGVSQALNQIKSAVAGINPQCQVMIGETGWSSQGISFNNTDNNVKNLVAYCEAIDKWASQQGVITYLFEAIDEPWKSDQNAPANSATPWQGPNGAEGHYGLWYLNDQGGYTQKQV